MTFKKNNYSIDEPYYCWRVLDTKDDTWWAPYKEHWSGKKNRQRSVWFSERAAKMALVGFLNIHNRLPKKRFVVKACKVVLLGEE